MIWIVRLPYTDKGRDVSPRKPNVAACLSGILADMTPYISHPEKPRLSVRDDSHIRYEEVQSTDSTRTHGYVIRCSEVAQLPISWISF